MKLPSDSVDSAGGHYTSEDLEELKKYLRDILESPGLRKGAPSKLELPAEPEQAEAAGSTKPTVANYKKLKALIDWVNSLPVGGELQPLIELENEVSDRWQLTERQTKQLIKAFNIVRLVEVRNMNQKQVANYLGISESAYYQRLASLVKGLKEILPLLVEGDKELENRIHTLFFLKSSSEKHSKKPKVGEILLTRSMIQVGIENMCKAEGTKKPSQQQIDNAIASLLSAGYIKVRADDDSEFEAAKAVYSGKKVSTWRDREKRAHIFLRVVHYMEEEHTFEFPLRLTADGVAALGEFINNCDVQKEHDALEPYVEAMALEDGEVAATSGQYAYVFGLWPKTDQQDPWKLTFNSRLLEWQSKASNFGGCKLYFTDRQIELFRKAFTKPDTPEMKKLITAISKFQDIRTGLSAPYVLYFGHGPTERRIAPPPSETSTTLRRAVVALLALTMTCLSLVLGGSKANSSPSEFSKTSRSFAGKGESIQITRPTSSKETHYARLTPPDQATGAKGERIS